MDADSAPFREAPAAADELIGRTVGAYRITQALGHGGMGVVYLAEQEAPLKRRVALKMIRPGLVSLETVRRFESERRALALMGHPNIARVLDAGSTPEGRLYFVMEYVAGAPITDHCDRQRLGLRARVELFLQVCRGVQHAHQKGVLHRDLKPSNILVASEDGRPTPKVIDFGIAKALQPEVLDNTLVTRQGVLIGTPGYMSPEQAELFDEDIDSTSDIYTLGVILYELLVGVTPLDVQALRTSSLAALQKAIRESELPRPSARLKALEGKHAEELARLRQSEPGALLATLRRDLDWIALKALERERARRYPAASELAADLQRWLDDEPVVARPPTAGYRLRKFTRRHRTLVVTASLSGLALLLGLAGTLTGLLRARRAEAEARQARTVAERESSKAQAVNQFLLEMLGSPDARQSGPDVKVVDVLDKAAARLESQQKPLNPETEAALRDTLGSTYQNLGQMDKAEAQLRRALAMRRAALGPEHRDTLASMGNLFAWLLTNNRLQEAEALGRETLQGQLKALGPDDPATTTTQNDMAVTLFQLGRLPEAEAFMRQVVETRKRVLGPEDSRTLVAASNLAALLVRMDRLDDAEALLSSNLAVQRRTLGPLHSNTLFTLKTLAGVYEDRGRLEQAEQAYREALEGSKRTSGPRQFDTLIVMNELGLLLMKRDRAAEAEPLLREALAGAEATVGSRHRFTGLFRRSLGRDLMAQKRYPAAEAELLRALQELQAAEGAARDAESVRGDLVKLYEAWGRPARAAAYRSPA